MAINYPNFPKLNASDIGGFGGFDLGSAIRSGLENYKSFQEDKALPEQLKRKAYSEQLANTINEAKAKYAEQRELAGLQNTRASTGHLGALTNLSREQLKMLPFEQQLKVARYNKIVNDMRQAQEFNDLLSGSSSNKSTNVSQEINKPTTYAEQLLNSQNQNMPGETKNNTSYQILSPGNASLSHLNEAWDKYPQYRKELEKRGIKKTETVKFDPRTGTTSIVTTMPNGEVRVKTSMTNGENSPATIAIKTANQKTINAINNARPIIQKIIDETKKGEVPGQWIGKYFQPDTQAAYESDVIQSSDTLAGALGFPGTNEGLHQAQQTVLRKPRESDKGYEKRLKTLLKDMDQREKTAQKTLNKGINLTPSKTSNMDLSHLSDEELLKIANGGK